MGMYGGIPYLVFAFLIIRVWILYGRKIPLVFIALLLLGRYTLPEMLGPFRFQIFVCLLAIVLLLIDRFKSVRWNAM
jgi:predicted membrane metal-binding protein